MPDVILVDDEPLARQGLRTLLAAHPEVRIVGEAGSAAPAQALIEATRPDAVFLDIEMADATGLDLVRGLERAPAIIFVTAHAHHAVDASPSRPWIICSSPSGRSDWRPRWVACRRIPTRAVPRARPRA